jgi:hypothetical protein
MIRGSAPPEVTGVVNGLIDHLEETEVPFREAFEGMANLLVSMVRAGDDDCTDAEANRRLAQIFSDTADALEAEEAAAGIKQH